MKIFLPFVSESASGPLYPAKKLEGAQWRIASKALTVKGKSLIDGEKVDRSLRLTPNQLFFIAARTVVRQDGQYITNVSADQMPGLVACKKALKRDYMLIVERLTKRQTSVRPPKPTPATVTTKIPQPGKSDNLMDTSAYVWYKYVGAKGTRIIDRTKTVTLRAGDIWGHHQDSKRTQIVMIAATQTIMRMGDQVKFERLVGLSKKTTAKPKLTPTAVVAGPSVAPVAVKVPRAMSDAMAGNTVNDTWEAMVAKLAAQKKVPRINEWFPCVLGSGTAQMKLVMYKSSSRSVVRLAHLVQHGGRYTLDLYKVKGAAIVPDGTKDLSTMSESARRVIVNRFNSTVSKAQPRNTSVPVVIRPENPNVDTTRLPTIKPTTAPHTLVPKPVKPEVTQVDTGEDLDHDGIIDVDELDFDAGDDLVDMIRRDSSGE